MSDQNVLSSYVAAVPPLRFLGRLRRVDLIISIWGSNVRPWSCGGTMIPCVCLSVRLSVSRISQKVTPPHSSLSFRLPFLPFPSSPLSFPSSPSSFSLSLPNIQLGVWGALWASQRGLVWSRGRNWIWCILNIKNMAKILAIFMKNYNHWLHLVLGPRY